MPLFPYEELTLDSPLPLSEVSQRLINQGKKTITGKYSLNFPNQTLEGKINDDGFLLVPQLGYRKANNGPAIQGNWKVQEGRTRIRLRIQGQKDAIYWTKFFFFLNVVLFLVCIGLQLWDYIREGKNNAYYYLCFPWIIVPALSYVQIWGRFKDEGRRAKINLSSLWETK